MKSILSTRVIAMGMILLSMVVIGGYYFLFREIEERTTHTSDMQNQIEEAVGQEGYLLSLKTMLADIKDDLKTLDTRLIPTKGTVLFLDQLETLGRFAGVKVTTDALGVGAVGGEADAFLEQIGLSISVEGTYASVRYFLSLLEALPYSITLPSVSLERSGTVGKNLWQGSFTITALTHK